MPSTPPASRLEEPSPSYFSLPAFRLFGIVLLTYFHFIFLHSTLLQYYPSPIYEGPWLAGTFFFNFPLQDDQILWFLLVGYLILLPRFTVAAPSWKEKLEAAAWYVCAAELVILLLHMPDQLSRNVDALLAAKATLASKSLLIFAIVPAAYFIQLIPIVGIVAFFVQRAFLQKYWKPILGTMFVCSMYGSLLAAQVVWETYIIRPALILTRLILWPFNSAWDARDAMFSNLIHFGNFTGRMIAPCAGLDWVFFFVTAYIAFWIYLSQERPVSNFRATVGLLGGTLLLFLANALRVAFLMVLGSLTSVTVVVDLFHSTMGLVISFLVMLGYLTWIFPWIAAPKNSTK